MTEHNLKGINVAYAKGVGDAIEFNRQAFEAFIASASLATKGYRELSENLIELTRSQLADCSECAKAVLASKSPKEAVDIQADFAKGAYEKSVSAGAKISEISLRTANEMLAPLGQRMNEGLDRIWKTGKAQ